MATADRLLELIFTWIQQREDCADRLRTLARELESLRAKCNGTECVGSSVSVVGAACLIGAGAATLFTGGAAAPFLGLLGAAYTGVGVTISVAAKLTEHFSTSSTMKEAQELETKNNEIADEIQRLFKKLKAEKEEVTCFADPDELDQLIMTEMLRAVAKRNKVKVQINFTFCGDEPDFFMDGGRRYMGFRRSFNPTAMVAFAGVLAFFTLEVSGKKSKLLLGKGVEQLIKQMSTTGFKTALKGGAMLVGGVVGMAFALPEAISNWEEQIKKNHVTEASQSLRDTADAIRKITRTLKEQFDDIKKMLDEMAERQQELEQESEVYQHVDDEESDEPEEFYVEEWQESDQDEETTGGQQDGGSDQGDEESSNEDEEDEESDEETDSEEETEDDESSDETIQKPHGVVRVGCLNCRSIKKKRRKVRKLIKENDVDIFLPTETWLRRDTADDVLTEASPQNFNSHHQAREGGRRGGGVGILFSPELQDERIFFNFITTFEYVATVVQRAEWDQPMLVVNVYHPPGYNLSEFREFLDEFQMLLDEVSECYDSILVTGDFNIWVDVERRTSTDEFEFLLLFNNLDQHVREPTHRGGHFLDLVISRNVEISDLTIRDDGIGSDHYSIYFNAKPRSKKRQADMKDDKPKRFRKKEE